MTAYKGAAVEAILDVQGLLHQQLQTSAMVQHCDLLAPIGSRVQPTSPFRRHLGVHSMQSHLQSPFGFPDVDLAATAGDRIYYIGLLTNR